MCGCCDRDIPCLFRDKSGKMLDISFCNISDTKYGDTEGTSVSELLFKGNGASLFPCVVVVSGETLSLTQDRVTVRSLVSSVTLLLVSPFFSGWLVGCFCCCYCCCWGFVVVFVFCYFLLCCCCCCCCCFMVAKCSIIVFSLNTPSAPAITAIVWLSNKCND